MKSWSSTIKQVVIALCFIIGAIISCQNNGIFLAFVVPIIIYFVGYRLFDYWYIER